MRADADADRVRRLLDALGRTVRSPTQVWLVGGATAVLAGWRPSTVDVDLVFEPESDAMFRAIAELKDSLDINVEIASPAHFLPELPGHRDHAVHVGRFGSLDVWHYDPRAQALSKILRDHDRDRMDVAAMLGRGMIEANELWDAFCSIRDRLIRYPRIDPAAFEARVRAVCGR